MVGVTSPDGRGGGVGLGLQGSELGLLRAGAGVLLVPAHQVLEAGHALRPAWEATESFDLKPLLQQVEQRQFFNELKNIACMTPFSTVTRIDECPSQH